MFLWLGDHCGFGVCGYIIFIKLKNSQILFFQRVFLFQGDRPSPALQGCTCYMNWGVLSPVVLQNSLSSSGCSCHPLVSCPPRPPGLPGFPGPPQLKKEHWVLPPSLPAVPQLRIPLTQYFGETLGFSSFVSWLCAFLSFVPWHSMSWTLLVLILCPIFLAVQVGGQITVIPSFYWNISTEGMREVNNLLKDTGSKWLEIFRLPG